MDSGPLFVRRTLSRSDQQGGKRGARVIRREVLWLELVRSSRNSGTRGLAGPPTTDKLDSRKRTAARGAWALLRAETAIRARPSASMMELPATDPLEMETQRRQLESAPSKCPETRMRKLLA